MLHSVIFSEDSSVSGHYCILLYKPYTNAGLQRRIWRRTVMNAIDYCWIYLPAIYLLLFRLCSLNTQRWETNLKNREALISELLYSLLWRIISLAGVFLIHKSVYIQFKAELKADLKITSKFSSIFMNTSLGLCLNAYKFQIYLVSDSCTAKPREGEKETAQGSGMQYTRSRYNRWWCSSVPDIWELTNTELAPKNSKSQNSKKVKYMIKFN